MCNPKPPLPTPPPPPTPTPTPPPPPTPTPPPSSRQGTSRMTYWGGFQASMKEWRCAYWGPKAWKLPVLVLALAVPIQFLADEYRHCEKVNMVQDRLKDKKRMFRELHTEMDSMYEEETCDF